jgi:hypothetical protein
VHIHFYDFAPEPPPALAEPTLISSQWFLNPFTVQDKLRANDYEVMVSPLFHVEGQPYRVIMDGHHSYLAAQMAGAEPILIESEPWHGINQYLARGDVLGGLKHQHQRMGPYYVASSRRQRLAWPPGSPYFMEA